MADVMGYPAQEGRERYVILRAARGTQKREATYVLVRECPFCHEASRVVVPAQGLWDWEHGMHPQEAFPFMSAEDREQVHTGIHPKCWDEGFGPEEDDEE